jgi:hypothetical protein
MTDKIQTCIAFPRSFAALARVASQDKEALAWTRTVLLRALPDGAVCGIATDGRALLRIQADAPTTNLELFAEPTKAAKQGTQIAVSADDLALLGKAAKTKQEDPPPLEVILGDEPILRSGSDVRRIQIEPQGKAQDGWPKDLDGVIPVGGIPVVQRFAAELFRDLLNAIVAAGGLEVVVEMRGGGGGAHDRDGLVLRAMGEGAEEIVGVLMPRAEAGKAAAGPLDNCTVTMSVDGRDPVTVTGKQFDRAMHGEIGRGKGRGRR